MSKTTTAEKRRGRTRDAADLDPDSMPLIWFYRATEAVGANDLQRFMTCRAALSRLGWRVDLDSRRFIAGEVKR